MISLTMVGEIRSPRQIRAETRFPQAHPFLAAKLVKDSNSKPGKGYDNILALIELRDNARR